MRTLYITYPESKGEGGYHLIADDGERLASHYCSHIGFAKSDLHDGRPERIKEFKQKFGEYNVKYLGDDEMTMEKLLELNEIWAEKQGIKQ